MLVIAYWELNPDIDPTEIGAAAQTLLAKGTFPPKGVKQLGWYVTAGDYWGIWIGEVDNEEAAVNAIGMWRIAKPGIFKVYKSSIAMKSEEVLPIIAKLAKTIRG